MNKFITKIAALSVGLAMAIGVGVAVGSGNRAVRAKATEGTLSVTSVSGANSDGTLSATVSKASGSSAPITATVDSHSGVRLYANNTMVVSASNNITDLSIVWYKNGSKTFADVTASVGTYSHASSSGETGTWSGSATEITFTVGSSGQVQLYEITYTVSGGSTQPYISVSPTLNGYTGGNSSLSYSAGNLTGLLSVTSGDTSRVTVGTPTNTSGSGTVQVNFVKATAENTPVTLSFKDGSTELATCNVTVVQTTVSLNKNSTTIPVNKSETLTASCNTGTANWTVTGNNKVSVSGGIVSVASDAVVGSTATVRATSSVDSNVYAECEVTVSAGPTYAIGFEEADGFTASTTYNDSTPYQEGATGQKWSIVCGHATTTAAAVNNGSMGMALRYYNSVGKTPYIEMQWDVTDGHEISFYAKGTASVSLKVEYSIDSGSNWSTLLASQSVTSSSFSLVSASISTYVAKARFRISSLSTTDKAGIYIDDLDIYTMEAPTEPTISITSKDGSGKMSGVLGSSQTVTWETDNDEGLTLNWILTNTESVVSWTSPNISFIATGEDAILTAQLKDGNDVVAHDSVALHTLVPSVVVKYNGSSNNQTIFAEDEGVVTADITNEPVGATISWSTDDTSGDYLLFDDSDGSVVGVAQGVVNITATVMYDSNSVATDSIRFTVKDLGVATLVVSTGEGKTSYKFGESLDTTGWTAVYTDRKGVESDVLSSLDFGSLNFIGTKILKATYNNVESNGIEITVTNHESSASSGSVSDTVSSKTGTSNMTAGHEYEFTLDEALENISEITLTLTVNVPTNSGGPYSHGITFKAYDDSANAYSSEEVVVACPASSTGNVFSAKITFSGNKTIAKVSYVFSTKAQNSNARDRVFSYVATSTIQDFDSKQVLAYARYFLEQTDGYCESSISSGVKTSLINEYGWMSDGAKAIFKAAEIVRGKGASYVDDVSQALSRYVNMIEEKGYVDSEFLNLGDDVINKAAAINNGVLTSSNSIITAVVVISLTTALCIGGYFFIRKKKEQ